MNLDPIQAVLVMFATAACVLALANELDLWWERRKEQKEEDRG